MKYACMLSIRFGTPCNKLVSGVFHDFVTTKIKAFPLYVLQEVIRLIFENKYLKIMLE